MSLTKHIVCLFIVLTCSNAVAETLPDFEIHPFERTNVGRNVYAAYKIDRKNNRILTCTAYHGAKKRDWGECVQHIKMLGGADLHSSSVGEILRLTQHKDVIPVEIWLIDSATGAVHFCAEDACVSIPDK